MTAIHLRLVRFHGYGGADQGLYSVFDVSKTTTIFLCVFLAILYTVVFVMTLLVSMGLMVFGDMLYEWLITVMPPAFVDAHQPL